MEPLWGRWFVIYSLPFSSWESWQPHLRKRMWLRWTLFLCWYLQKIYACNWLIMLCTNWPSKIFFYYSFQCMQHLYTCKGSAMRVSIYFYTEELLISILWKAVLNQFPMKGSICKTKSSALVNTFDFSIF